MRIQDIEAKSGLDRATIRFYEKEGLITPVREENGYRSYSDDDLLLLQKVKLLRRLGVSLQTIKALQQGSEDFAVVLQQQIETLEQNIKDDTIAKNVCVEMQQSRADYRTLDSQKYLKMFDTQETKPVAAFSEHIVREYHPWRRFFARMIDLNLTAAFCQFLIVVILRVRPYSEGLELLVQYGSYLIAVPLLALLLHKLGTTPGKWVMGIRVESINGEKPDFSVAFAREKSVLWYGLGLFIPFYHLWRLYKSYKADVEGEENEWTYGTEIVYTDWRPVMKIGIAVIYCVTLLINLCSTFDTVMPKRKYDQMTVAQFAENYETYDRILDYRSNKILGEDGKWTERSINTITVEIGSGNTNHIRPDFQYVTNGNIITSVGYSDYWEGAAYLNVIPSYCCNAMYTMIGSRPAAWYKDLLQLENTLNNDFVNDVKEAIENGRSYGECLIADVKLSWSINISNCDLLQNGMLISLEDEVQYSLNILMEIQE